MKCDYGKEWKAGCDKIKAEVASMSNDDLYDFVTESGWLDLDEQFELDDNSMEADHYFHRIGCCYGELHERLFKAGFLSTRDDVELFFEQLRSKTYES